MTHSLPSHQLYGILGNSFLKVEFNWLGNCFRGSLMKGKVPQYRSARSPCSTVGREIDFIAPLKVSNAQQLSSYEIRRRKEGTVGSVFNVDCENAQSKDSLPPHHLPFPLTLREFPI